MFWRILVNDQTARYRVEIRRWWGWEFVLEGGGQDYRTFETAEEARRWACENLSRSNDRHRRWRVIDLCCRPCPSN